MLWIATKPGDNQGGCAIRLYRLQSRKPHSSKCRLNRKFHSFRRLCCGNTTQHCATLETHLYSMETKSVQIKRFQAKRSPSGRSRGVTNCEIALCGICDGTRSEYSLQLGVIPSHPYDFYPYDSAAGSDRQCANEEDSGAKQMRMPPCK